MKRIVQFVLFCLVVNVFLASADEVTIYATRYKLRIYNYSEESGAQYDPTSQTAVPIGMYSRPSGYDAEILCDFDLSGIPAGAAINSVDFGYNVSSVSGGPHPVKVFENTRSWSGTPTYNTFGNTSWPSSDLLVQETASGTGWHDFTGNANMKSLVEGWLASPSSNRGLVLTDVPNYWGWEIDVTRARFVVDYTPMGPPPVITISASPPSGDAPLTVDFTATNTGGPVNTWSWDFGDGGNSSTQNPTYIYNTAGVYTATLTATGPGGSDVGTVEITVTAPPVPPAITVSASPQSGEAPLTVDFTATNTGGPVNTWSWDFGDGGNSSTQNPTYIYNTAGVYTATLTATGPGGSDVGTVEITVTAPPVPPAITVSASPQSGEAPLTVDFTATNTGGPVNTWSWDFGDGGNSSTQNPTYVYNTAGVYTATLTATGPGGSDVGTVEITVTELPVPPVITVSANPQSGEVPLQVTFTATVISGPVDTWHWDFGDGTSSTVQNPPPHIYTTAGTYTAVLTATNVAGDGTDQVTINVVTATATLTMTVVGQGTTTPSLGDTTVEEGTPVPISAIPGAGYDFIEWLVVTGSAVIDNPAQSATNVTLSDNAAIQAHFALKEYTLTVTAGQNGSTNPTGAVVVIHGVPVPVVALPEVGYNFALWSVVTGNATIANPTAETTNVVLDNGDAEILATFVTDTNYTPYSQMLSITGTLYDEYGNPVGYPDPVDVDASIRLVTEETAGDTMYTETFYAGNGKAVEVDNGLFVARLGSGTTVNNLQAVLAAYENLFVEITVENGTPDVLLPRTPLTSGGYTLTGPPTATLQLNTIHGSGDPNALNVPGRVGMYYIDDETGATYLKLNTGWKLMD